MNEETEEGVSASGLIEDDDLPSQAPPPPELSRQVDLPSGKALKLKEAVKLMSSVPATIVVLLGDPYAGKTTILCALWEHMQRGTLRPYLFAGSRTCVAFEQRCFKSRVDSEADTPDTVRTPRREAHSDGEILHFGLRHPSASEPVIRHLLLPDLSGEDLRALRDVTGTKSDFPMVARASAFTFVVDGKRLADKRQRKHACSSVLALVRRMMEEGLITRRHIQVVASKADLFDGATKQYAQESLEEIARFARDGALSATTHITTTRSSPDGLTKLLSRWCDAGDWPLGRWQSSRAVWESERCAELLAGTQP